MTSHEAWAKEKPKVEHLRVFGCDAYAHIPKDERQKLDPKTRLYDPNQGKVFHSHDVKFNESEKEREADTNNDPVYCVELDFLDRFETTTEPEAC